MSLSLKLYGYYDKFLKLLGQDDKGGIKGWYRDTTRIQDVPKDVSTAALTSDVENSIRILTDEPTNDAPDFKKYTNQLSKLIVNSIPRFTVGIYGGWGTGKTTIMKMIKDEIDRNHSDKVKTVWFDAWRYEKEQYSAMVPLLRTISLSLRNTIENSKDSKKKYILTKLEGHVSKLGGAILRHTNVNITANVGAGSGGVQSDIGKIMDDYKSDGSIIHGQERIYFHKHITDHLQEELQKIRKIEEYDFRLVFFVDDLDRCTPERALELLESIKTFFDIEGIVYVIGIDPTTIDSLIQTKYGKETKVDGMDYLQKIVQLPFQVPVWSPVDLSKTISAMIERAGMNMSEFEPILKQTSTELIINAADLNPRDIKRFVNSIILATYVYEHDIKDIEKLIAVQAFYFHGSKWIDFLKLLFPYKNRIEFLKDFISLNEKQSSERQGLTLEDLKKIRAGYEDQEKKSTSLDKPILEIYKKLVELDDEDLLIFLRASASALIKIDRIEKYLRAVEETNLPNKRKSSFDIDSEEQLKLLRDINYSKEQLRKKKVEDFNLWHRMTNISLIHLPYENFHRSELNSIDLNDAFLFKVVLNDSNLSNANLGGADLSNAYLSRADLTYANLSGAKLLGADLGGADLSNADLTYANLSGADLSYANLSGAHLSNANLEDANLSGAILVHNKYEKSINKNTNFDNAVIDNPEYIKYLHSDGAQNIPNEIKSKQELRSLLQKRNIGKDYSINDLLDLSDLKWEEKEKQEEEEGASE